MAGVQPAGGSDLSSDPPAVSLRLGASRDAWLVARLGTTVGWRVPETYLGIRRLRPWRRLAVFGTWSAVPEAGSATVEQPGLTTIATPGPAGWAAAVPDEPGPLSVTWRALGGGAIERFTVPSPALLLVDAPPDWRQPWAEIGASLPAGARFPAGSRSNFGAPRALGDATGLRRREPPYGTEDA